MKPTAFEVGEHFEEEVCKFEDVLRGFERVVNLLPSTRVRVADADTIETISALPSDDRNMRTVDRQRCS